MLKSKTLVVSIARSSMFDVASQIPPLIDDRVEEWLKENESANIKNISHNIAFDEGNYLITINILYRDI